MTAPPGSPQVTARVDLAGVRAFLKELANRYQDLSPVFRGPVDALTTQAFLQQFETRGSHLNGARWQPLSVTTMRLRTRVIVRKGVARTTPRVGQGRAGFSAPLRNTNRAWASLVKTGAPEGVRVITPSTYERGSRVAYLAKHQTGFTITSMFGRQLAVPKKVPARPIVPAQLPTHLVQGYETVLLAYLQKGVL